ncbi:DUF3299 domain-containing protein [Oceanimonas baumannii]|uniref:DUF3299 domain-containing protein n=1 Tax=Oceanimonas baumannii TaxID=129578 RepID=A0A235CAF5_9GAMM|nr:DUF3299 domain-containing protein [Oceanimonas baumannii]OYD21396.1 hypothetical protein B6S09_15825 [Oceanimonas baumannii]TDW56385.1 hypothetical protein LY04_03009 [Oceanimonas baumannii]
MKLTHTLLGLALLATPALADDFQLTDWNDLIPLEEQLNPPPFPEVDHNDEFAIPGQPVGKVVPAMNGKKIRLPGFVVPLEGDSEHITRFFLVPYFGACIHVPPPPTNQIVYVNYPKGARVDDLWDAVWVAGTLSTVSASNDIADAAYSLEGVSVEPYDL